MSLESILRSIEPALDTLLPRQRNDGSVVEPSLGIADATGSMQRFIGWLGLAVIADAKHPGIVQLPEPADQLIARGIKAVSVLQGMQHPSGCVDLSPRDYDSSPSTAFVVQTLCCVPEVGRDVRKDDPAWQRLLAEIETFVRKGARGMIDRGFHTPNHRWVVSSALAHAGGLYPDLPARPTIDAYLAEGIDINAEGAYTERSAGIYDGISNVSLLLLGEHVDHAPAKAAVKANLAMNLSLLNRDGSVETGLSHRQDHGVRSVPDDLGACYYWQHQLEPDPRFAAAANLLWRPEIASATPRGFWYVYAALKYGHRHATGRETSLGDSTCCFSQTGFWSHRRGRLTAGVFKDNPRLLGFRFGRAELCALQVFNSYMGTGRFVGDTMDVTGDTVTLRCQGHSAQFGLPGSWQPLGRRLDADNKAFWSKEVLSQRQLLPQPKWTGTVAITPVENGFDLLVKLDLPYDGITAQVSFDFPPGGVWETGDCATETQKGQILFLKHGQGTMRYGNDVIEIAPGHDAHRIWRARDSEPAPGLARVIVPFVGSMEHRFTIRCSRGW